ncbi:MAG: hypothetical protein M3394_01360 [Actinomycetota bacterium]|nr:hypothetical protein [Actinomycetota bacterium]
MTPSFNQSGSRSFVASGDASGSFPNLARRMPDGVDVARRGPGIVRDSHRGAADDEHISPNARPTELVVELAEQPEDACPREHGATF